MWGMHFVELYSFLSIPSVQNIVFLFQDGFHKLEITGIVLCDKNCNIAFMHTSAIELGSHFTDFLHLPIWNRKPKGRSFTHLRFYTHLTAHPLHNRLTNR